MNQLDAVLPAEFHDLEPFAPGWAELATTDERYAARRKASIAQLRAFYTAVSPRVQRICEHLDAFTFDLELPAPEQRLYRIALALTEVAAAIELFDRPDVPHCSERHVVRARWTAEA